MVKVKLLLGCILIGCGYGVKAQNISFRPSVGYGFIVPHNPRMRVYITHHIYNIGLDWNHQTEGSEPWHHWFNFPSWGLNFSYFNLGNDTLGKALGTMVYADLPLNKKRTVYLGLYAGIGYLTRHYDVDNDPKNTAIGSPVNAALRLQLSALLLTAKNVDIRGLIQITHFSNGAISMPNLGINLPCIGIMADISGKKTVLPERDNPAFDRGWNLWAGGALGAKQMSPLGSPTFAIANLYLLGAYRVSGKSALGPILDFGYNAGHYWALTRMGERPPHRLSCTRVGIGAWYGLHLGKITISFELGYYLISLYKETGTSVFNRYMISYTLSSRLRVTAGLRAHFAKADHPEIGLSYKIAQP